MHQKFCGTWFTAAAAKSHQSCPTLCDPTDGSPPGSSVPGILQARILEWVAMSFSSAWKWKAKMKSLSHVPLLTTTWTVAHQAPPSVGFPRQEYWSGCHCLLLIYCFIMVVWTQACIISEVHLYCCWLALLSKMISLVYLLASYCCCNNLPQTRCLNTTHIYFVTILEVTHLKISYTGLKSRLWGETHFLAFSYLLAANGTPLQHSCLENPMDGGAW